MYCNYCDEEIQDGEEYRYIDVLDVILHEDCVNDYIYDITTIKIRNIDDEKASVLEE